jgi:hypothetical protein
MIGPYLRSAIIRDAAVTTWLRAAVSPIDGKIVTELPHVGSLVGENGHIATIRNDLLLQERSAVEDTRDKIINSQSKIKEADEYLADLKQIE